MQPIIKEIIAESKTAEADMSFIFLTDKLKVGQTISQSFSIAELIISKLNTTEKQTNITIHSIELNEKKNPAAVTITATINCILKFFS